MKFSEFKYVRPNIEEIETEFKALLKEFNEAENADLQNEIIRKINKIRSKVETAFALANVGIL